MSKNTDGRKQKFLEALAAASGNKSTACENCKIGRRTVYEWIDADEEFAKSVDEVSEGVIDFVEDKLHTLIKDNNVAAIIFFLKTRAKHRGYTESSDMSITLPKGGIKVQVIASGEQPITSEDDLPE